MVENPGICFLQWCGLALEAKFRNSGKFRLGPNPFDYLGLLISTDGRKGTPTVWDGSQCVYYSDIEAFGIEEQLVANRGSQLQLSHWLPVYDWVMHDGFDNFNSWIS
jgi:hypothetical protein